MVTNTNSTKKNKLVLIGWDAADWKMINPLIEQGLMPSLEQLINEGVMANLATLDPPFSPMLWTSIATGKRPYKHGIHGFHEAWDKGAGIRPIRSTNRKCKAIWNMLSQQEYKSHVVSWWPSHPVEPINGVMVSDLFYRPSKHLYDYWPVPKNSVFPPDLSTHFSKFRIHPGELNSAHIDPFLPKWKKATPRQRKAIGAVARETAMAASLHGVFTNILRTYDWDFATLYLAAIDHYAHGFMAYHPPKRTHISQSDYDFFKDVMQAAYQFHDMMLGRILELIEEDTYILLVSDHGFQPDHLRPRSIPKEPAGPAYEHSPQGVFVLRGPGIRKDEIIFGASLLDICPTILHLFDLPIGKDMDGKVLSQIYESPRAIQYIDSWDSYGAVYPNSDYLARIELEEEEELTQLALEQLEELGYLDRISPDAEKNKKYAEEEAQFNLARAYIDGGLIEEAIVLLEALFKANQDTQRFGLLLASSYQKIGRQKECRAIMERLRDKEIFNPSAVDVIEGSLLLGEGKAAEALDFFKKAEGKVNPIFAKLSLYQAQAYIAMEQWDQAEAALQESITVDYDYPQAHGELGRVLLRTHQYEAAVDALLNAIGLKFEYPNAHYWLGLALGELKQYKEAAQAFEWVLQMEVNKPQVRDQLIYWYEHRLSDSKRAQYHREKINRT